MAPIFEGEIMALQVHCRVQWCVQPEIGKTSKPTGLIALGSRTHGEEHRTKKKRGRMQESIFMRSLHPAPVFNLFINLSS